MSLPNVNMAFAPGNQLQGAAVANVDNVFMVVGAASLATPNTIIPIVDPGTIPALAGYGPGPELCAQILANGAGTVYLVAGNKSVVNNGTFIYGVVAQPIQSRPNAPGLVALSVVGFPGQPLQPSFTNTGSGSVSFDENTNGLGAFGPNSADIISVQITQAGQPGAGAQGTVTVGTNVYTNQSLSTPWSQPSVSQPVILDFAIPLGGQFQVGDYFSAVPTPNDSYNVVVTISSINQYGQALFTYSLDGGVTTSGQINAPLGGVLNTTGMNANTAPDWSGSPAAPTNDSVNVSLVCTQAGNVSGVASQCSQSSGVLQPGNNTGDLVVTVTNAGNCPVPVNVALVAHGSVVTDWNSYGPGTVTYNGSPTIFTPTTPPSPAWTPNAFSEAGCLFIDQTGAAFAIVSNDAVSLTMNQAPAFNGTNVYSAVVNPGTTNASLAIMSLGATGFVAPVAFDELSSFSDYTDSTTGIEIEFSSSPTAPASGDTFSIQIAPPVLFTPTVNGSTSAAVPIPSDGILSVGGLALQFPTGGNGQVVYPVGCTVQFWAYPQFTYVPQERDGSYCGFAFTFQAGVSQAGDTYQFQCAAPYIANADALNTLSVITSSKGYPYSMVQLYTGCIDPDNNDAPDWAVAMDLAESVNTALLALVPAPTFQFKRAFICGPDATSATSGATPNDFINASSGLSLDRVMTGAGADYITSALTGRRDLRNHGVADIARLAAIPVQTDPGGYTLGPLLNVVSTTTPAADATIFNGNRAMAARTFDGIPGVFEAEGLTLSTPGGDYSTVMNCRVIDKAAYSAQQALLPYGINRTVPTVPGKGTLTPAFATLINNDVAAQTTKSCTGNFQSIAVSASTTDVLIPNGTESVTIAIQPWGYISTINATIGFTL